VPPPRVRLSPVFLTQAKDPHIARKGLSSFAAPGFPASGLGSPGRSGGGPALCPCLSVCHSDPERSRRGGTCFPRAQRAPIPRNKPAKNNFLKNSPKLACQPPSAPQPAQNPYEQRRFLSTQLGIIPSPTRYNLTRPITITSPHRPRRPASEASRRPHRTNPHGWNTLPVNHLNAILYEQ
jgi:hypothetical protein